MGFSIETQNLVLRDFRLDDLEDYCAFTRDRKYQRFYNEEDCTLQRSAQLLEQFVEQAQEVLRQKYQLAICEKHSVAVIGTCGIRREPNDQASVGCGLARECQRSGAAEEAMTAILRFGFDELNVQRAYAETIEGNRAAIKLCERLGLRHENTALEHQYFKGKWWNTVTLAVLRDEWYARTSN